MKGVFYASLIILLSLFISCGDISPAVFTFVNNRSADTVTITPDSSEEWNGFTLSAGGGSHSIESENSNIYFSVLIDGVIASNLYADFTYDADSRTYTFSE